jgi:hypothetical protein
MSLNRRKFLKLGSVTIAGLPLSSLTANAAWYTAHMVPAETELYTLFKDPSGTAKPFVRWWWNGLRVVKEELLRELDMLKELGIGGVEINSIRFPETADPLQYKEFEWLSDGWMEMLQFTLKAAKERGIICDVIMGSGWPFGGEFLTKDEQTQIMALQTKDLKGPQTLQITKAELLKLAEPPIASKHDKRYKELSVLRLAPAKLDNLETILDLDAEVDKDTITIQVPEGDHVLYFLVKITGFMAVMYGAPGASGPVLNHYNKDAVQKYLNKMSDAITPKLGLMGENFRSVFTDSLELEGANWCDDMFDEFKKRRKYSLKPYLPFILFKTGRLGRALNEKYGSVPTEKLNNTLQRVRYDFEITKMELFQERFLDTFLDWCKKNKVKSRVQAYGREYHPLESSMQIDIPECETWIRRHTGEEPKEFDYQHGRTYSEVNKFVSSGARLSNKKIISCEEITNTELVFNATLERIKITGDQSNLSGVTHSILHGFNYSPKDAVFPGWIRYGTFFNERNPWWPYLEKWVSYKSRLSAVFQNGVLMSDIAVMHPLPDLWSQYAAQWDPFPERALPDYVHNVWEAIHQCGSGCDYISENILQKAAFLNGKLSYGPRQYKILLIIEAETIYPETARALSRFAEAGGQIVFIGKTPYKAPGHYNHEEFDLQVSNTIAGLKKNKGVALYPAPDKKKTMIDWYKGVQAKFNIKPFFSTDNPQPSVNQVYYTFGNTDAFFISNCNSNQRFEFNAAFNVDPHKTAWLWDPETGKRYLYKTEGASHKLKIKLGPAESQLIIFDHHTRGEKQLTTDVSKKPVLQIITPWNLTLNHVNGSKKTIQLAELVDFKENETLVSFAGNAIYENSFQLNELSEISLLNLGKVIGVSEVTLNGVHLGSKWYGDHIYPVKGRLKKGKNTLSIKFTTTLGNYMYSLKDNKDAVKWIKGKKQSLYAMGILGPVEFS